MNLEQIIIQTLIEYQFGDNLKNGDYVTGVKKMYFGEVAAMVVKKYNDIHNVSKCLCCDKVKKLTHCEECGNDIGIVDN
jgi:hypothetical protein